MTGRGGLVNLKHVTVVLALLLLAAGTWFFLWSFRDARLRPGHWQGLYAQKWGQTAALAVVVVCAWSLGVVAAGGGEALIAVVAIPGAVVAVIAYQFWLNRSVNR